jgi:hypothetical protein
MGEKPLKAGWLDSEEGSASLWGMVKSDSAFRIFLIFLMKNLENFSKRVLLLTAVGKVGVGVLCKRLLSVRHSFWNHHCFSLFIAYINCP